MTSGHLWGYARSWPAAVDPVLWIPRSAEGANVNQLEKVSDPLTRPAPLATLSRAQCAALGAPAGTAGHQRWVTLQLQDSTGQGILRSGVTAADTLTPPPNNPFGMGTSIGSYRTDSSAKWPDQYFVCTTACPGSTAKVTVGQSWTANSMKMGHVNSIVYSCSSITIDGH